MASHILDSSSSPKRAENRKLLLIIGLSFSAMIFLTNDVLGLINGGGLFSDLAAYRSLTSKPTVIEVDGAGLRTVLAVVCSLAGVSLALWLRLDVQKRLVQFLLLVGIIGGAFMLDGIYDESLITALATKHGYSRCDDRDHPVGAGKGRVWFHVYVLHANECSAKQ
jgi:hypothetical protein